MASSNCEYQPSILRPLMHHVWLTETFFVYQEGNASVSVNGETKELSKDDVILIPSGAK